MTRTDSLTAQTVGRARLAVFAVFALAGAAFSAVATRIPDLRQSLDLTPGDLGVTLLAMSVGSLLGMPLAGRATAALGVRRTVVTGATSAAVGLLLLAWTIDAVSSRPGVMVALLLLGLGVGVWDVAMNLEAAVVERLWGRSVMPHFHAAFSAGTVLSALLGAALIAAGVPTWVHLGGAAVLAYGWVLASVRAFLPAMVHAADDPAGDSELPVRRSGGAAGRQRAGARTTARPVSAARATPRSAWTEPRTLLIGVLTLCAAFTEGTANDWLAVALIQGYDLPNWAGVLGFASFLTFMTVGRVVGAGLLDRYGRVVVLRALFCLGVLGAALVILGGPVLAFVGAALWGLGASLGFPVGMSAASDDPRRAAARVSVVATIGYLAFLAGPPTLGLLGDHVGVLNALAAVAVLSAVALAVVPAARETRGPHVGR